MIRLPNLPNLPNNIPNKFKSQGEVAKRVAYMANNYIFNANRIYANKVYNDMAKAKR